MVLNGDVATPPFIVNYLFYLELGKDEFYVLN